VRVGANVSNSGRQERCQRSSGHGVPVPVGRLEVLARSRRKVRDHRPKRRRGSPSLQALARDAVLDEHRAGQRHPILAQVLRKRLQQADQAQRQAEMTTCGARRFLRRSEQVQGAERDLAPAGPEPILERHQIGRRPGAQLLLARVDRGIEARAQRCEAAPACMQRLDHGMGKRPAGSDPLQGIAPPLQAHEPGHRFADDPRHPPDLVIERVEDEQRFARLGGREQGREIAVRIVLTNLDRRI
jgi:hypothetical protein